MLPFLLALIPARADVPAADRWLATDHVAVGLHQDGSLVNTSAPGGGLGLRFDPDGPTGPMPLGGDALLPGRKFEVWSMQTAADVWVSGGPDKASDVVLDWTASGDNGATGWLIGEGDGGSFTVIETISVAWEAGLLAAAETGDESLVESSVVWLDLEVTATTDLEEVWLARTFDPDPDYWIAGDATTTSLADGDAAVGQGAWDGRSIALAAVDGTAGVCAWCTTAEGVLAGSLEGSGDDQLGVAVEIGDLSGGGSVLVTFAYGLGEDAEVALAAARWAAATTDRDGDGWAESDGDCDDTDPWAAPDLAEQQDGVDNDCDGAVDEDAPGEGDVGDGWGDEPPGDTTGEQPADIEGSSGCSSVAASPVVGWPLVLLALGAGRRRARWSR